MGSPLSPQDRRERNRREMVETILAAARAVMQEQGVAALNLNEVARRVRLRPQSLAEYFPTKMALYDALFLRAIAVFQEGDERAYRNHPPGWGQIEEWFANRIALADDNPDLHRLALDGSTPDYLPPDRVTQQTQILLEGARRMVSEAITAGAISPGMPVDHATDVLLSIRHGLVAERLGKRRFIPPQSDRFAELLPHVLRMVRTAWDPRSVAPDGRSGSAVTNGGTHE